MQGYPTRVFFKFIYIKTNKYLVKEKVQCNYRVLKKMKYNKTLEDIEKKTYFSFSNIFLDIVTILSFSFESQFM